MTLRTMRTIHQCEEEMQMKIRTINVDVVNNNIVCSEGGHLRGHKDDKVVWDSSNYKFSLRFALLTGSGEANWPFQGGAASPSEVRHFEGALALADPNNPPAYKYTVFVDGYVPLDPIIIVDRN
jgi:hypothetical protein